MVMFHNYWHSLLINNYRNNELMVMFHNYRHSFMYTAVVWEKMSQRAHCINQTSFPYKYQ
jgi:hypothetical protein